MPRGIVHWRRTLPYAAVAAALLLAAACERGGAARPPATRVPPDTAERCAPSRPATAGSSTLTIASGGATRTYILHVPPKYDGTTMLPLLIDLHGAGSNKEQQSFYSGFARLADAQGFVVVTPDGAGAPRQWNFLGLRSGADDRGFLSDVLDRTEATLCIDQARVYVAGISSGGAMSISLACALPGRITAAASVAALYLPAGCLAARAIPLIEFHGTDDRVVPFHGGTVGGLPSPDVERAAAAWAAGDGCATDPQTTGVSAHVTRHTYIKCRGGVSVQLYVIEGGGHTWPGARADVALLGSTTQEVHASDLIWQFFEAQPRLSANP